MKKIFTVFGAFMLVLLSNTATYSHGGGTSLSDGLHFVENKNQWVQEVRFRAGVAGGAVFITDAGLVYNFNSTEDLDRVHDAMDSGGDVGNMPIRHHAYKVNFVGARGDIEYVTDEKRPFYHNYFLGNDQSRWVGGVNLFGRVVQRNVYDGIDVAIYSKGASLKYDFIAAPGADVSKILLEFDGVSPVIDKEGNLKITTSVNEVIEEAPYAYQIIDGREVVVSCNYRLTNGRLSFDLPKGYNKQYPLVIDPQLIFATYSGGSSGSPGFYSFSTTYDDTGCLYAGAQAYHAGWPVTTGAFQTVFAGGNDVAVNKYTSDGSGLIYSTFYGGAGVDLPYAMVVNKKNELIVTGQTESFNLPVSTGCYDNSLGGSRDLFVVHFNANGTGIIGSTYVGGSGLDVTGIDMISTSQTGQHKTSPVEVLEAENGDIWVISNTNSTDFPVTSNAIQSTLAGNTDAVVFRMNSNLSQMLYSTYLGGNANDAGYGIAFDNDGNVVVCGGTQSANFPVTSGVLNNTAPGGTWDGFISVIDKSTGALIASSFLGTNNTDQAIFLQIEPVTNYYYVMGRTLGNYPISTGVYSMPTGDIFVDVLTPDLATSVRSTRLGNPQNSSRRFSPSAFLLDICGNIYLAGLNSETGLPLKDQVETDRRPFWFCVLERGFSDLLFASYFGTTADHSHVGVHRFDPAGVVYHSVCCNATNYPTTSGVWAERKHPTLTGQDIVSFKFNFDATGVRAGFVLDGALSDTSCAPFEVNFKNTSIVADTFLWDLGDGTFSTVRSPSHLYDVPGTYVVSLFARNDSACITNDTFRKTIVVLPNPEVYITGDTITCVNNPIQLNANIKSDPGVPITIAWTPTTGLDDPTSANPWAMPTQDVMYKVRVTAEGGCYDEDSIHITVIQGFDLLNSDTAICIGETVQTNVVGDSRYTYKWTPNQGVSDVNIMTPTITPNNTRTYILTASFPGCRDSVRSFEIDVQPVPDVYAGADTIICFGDTMRLTPVIVPPNYEFYTYTWNPAGGLEPNASVSSPLYTGYQTSTLTLTVTTPAGCTGADDILIEVASPDIIEATNDTLICPGDTIQLSVWGNQVSQVWRPAYYISDTLSTDPLVYPVNTVTYIVYGWDVNNCMDTQSVHVRVLPQAVIALPDSVRIYPGESYQLSPGGNCLYFEWFPHLGLSDPNVANPIAAPDVNTRYFVNARTENGCMVSDSIDVFVDLDSYLDVPNAFAPGGSGPNRLLRPVRRGHVTLKNFAVYNRWGVKMFETKTLDEGWDGNFNGEPQPMGVYVYVVEAVTPTGREIRKQGNTTLLR